MEKCGVKMGLLFYLFCFVLNMGEIAYLYAGGNSPVEKEKNVAIGKRR